MKHSESIAQRVAKYVRAEPVIEEALVLSIINARALARKILPRANAAQLASAAIAIKRLEKRLSRRKTTEKKIRDILTKSKLVVRNRMMVVAIKRDYDYRRYLALQSALKERGEEVTIIEGFQMLTIITGSEHADAVRKVFGKQISELHRNVSLIMLLVGREAMYTRGFSAFVLSILSRAGVNVLEELTSSGEHLLVVEESDLMLALNTLELYLA